MKAAIAALQERDKSLREELLRRGFGECQGAALSVQVTDAIRWTLTAPLPSAVPSSIIGS